MVSAPPLSTATSAQVYLNHSSRGGWLTSSDAGDAGGTSPTTVTVEAGGALTTREAGEAGWALTGTETVETGGELTAAAALVVAGIGPAIWATSEAREGTLLILRRIGGWLGSHSAPGFIVAWFSLRHFSKTERTTGGGQMKDNDTAEKLKHLEIEVGTNQSSCRIAELIQIGH
jgi:hypothetical protein